MGVYFKGYEISEWQINKSYSIGSVVKYNNKEYVAIKDVPSGINIGMKEYWKSEDVESRLENLESDVEDIDEYIQGLSVDDLTDVNITGIEDGDILVYDDESGMFVPQEQTTGGTINYSETEQEIGLYLGEKLYQKTFTFESVSGASTRTYTDLIDLTSYNIKRIVSINGTWGDGDVLYKAFPWVDTNNVLADVAYNRTTKYLQLLNSGFNNASFNNISITLQYTKTTT